MLSLADCIAFCGLTPEQVDAVACYKHVPEIIAAEWAESALETEHGCAEVETILAEEVACARTHHPDRIKEWECGLREFRRDHPNHS